MNREALKSILLHREPMLLLDEAHAENDGSACGSYTVCGDEWFLQGHFPGNPVVPGVILCEIMAQSCCLLLGEKIRGKTPYFTGMDRVKFREKVCPGDTLTVKCRLLKSRGAFCFAQGEGYVKEKLAVSGEFSFALI